MKQDIPQSVSRRSSRERLAVGRVCPVPPGGNSYYTAGAAWRGGGTRRSQEPVEDEVSKSKSKSKNPQADTNLRLTEGAACKSRIRNQKSQIVVAV
jgi:hypothetical protein